MTDLAAPASLKIASATLAARDTVAETRSVYSNAESRLDFGGEWWELTIVTPPQPWDDAADLEAWCDRLREAGNRASLHIPGLTPKRGTTTASTIQATATTAAGERELPVDGLGNAATLLAGSFVSIAGRLHRLRQSVTATSGGAATLELFPRLRASVADNATIQIGNGVVGLWRLQSRPGHDFSVASLGMAASAKTLTFVEAL